MLPPTILTEVIAQVGAILILAKPENQQRLPFFAGIERVRYRRPVHPGDVVDHRSHGEAAAQPHGRAGRRCPRRRQVVVEGTMTFALGPRGSKTPASSAI